MAKKLTQEEMSNWRKFRIPNTSNLHRIKVDVINLNRTNHMLHEMKKCEVAFELMQQGKRILTEAEECKKPNRRFDVIDITNNDIYEIIYKHESDEDIKEYRRIGIIPIIVNPMICEKCGKKYPKRNKKNICKGCK